MKKLYPYLFIVLFILSSGFWISCKNNSEKNLEKEEALTFITQDFEARFLGDYTYVGPDTLTSQKCTDTLSAWRAIVDCKGNSTLMGDIRAHFDFCGDTLGNYGNTYAYIVDKDSDTLFITCEGTVIQGKLESHPSFVTSYWKDPFQILGGTGKYEKASGSGITNDYNSSEDPNSHHLWTGSITMVKMETEE